jgi:serine/threonine protein kinase
MDAEAMDLAIGAPLRNGRYEIGLVLGRGAFGITYLGWDPNLNRKIAIKEFLPAEIATRSGDQRTVVAFSSQHGRVLEYARERFRQEARVITQFEHPNIIRVLDFFADNGTEYMVMDYYPGQTLGAMLESSGALPEEPAVDLMSIVLAGLEEVHRERDGQRHVHRDIKPSNIYLASVGQRVIPKILDFGAARVAIGERSRNLTQVLTPGYAPFEQYMVKGRQGPWSDVYACAATLYHMLTGERPMAALDRYESDQLRPPHELSPEISRAVSDAVMEGLALDVKNRPADAAAFRSVLRATVRRIPTTKHWDAPPEDAAPPSPQPERSTAATPAPAPVVPSPPAPSALKPAPPAPPAPPPPPAAAAPGNHAVELLRGSGIGGLETVTSDEALAAEIQSGGAFVVFDYCISFGATWERTSPIYYRPPGGSLGAQAAWFAGLSALFGWWGLRGPGRTLAAIGDCLTGGRDVSDWVIDRARAGNALDDVPPSRA